MIIKKIKDYSGANLQIDEETRSLYEYNNEKRIIVYNAEIVENGEHTGRWTNYTENGTVDSIEERLQKWNNKVQFLYAASVGFKASKNDPEKEKYKKIVNFVEENSEKFFTESGDFREEFLTKTEDFHEGFIINEEIKNLMKDLL